MLQIHNELRDGLACIEYNAYFSLSFASELAFVIDVQYRYNSSHSLQLVWMPSLWKGWEPILLHRTPNTAQRIPACFESDELTAAGPFIAFIPASSVIRTQRTCQLNQWDYLFCIQNWVKLECYQTKWSIFLEWEYSVGGYGRGLTLSISLTNSPWQKPSTGYWNDVV